MRNVLNVLSHVFQRVLTALKSVKTRRESAQPPTTFQKCLACHIHFATEVGALNQKR